MLNALAAGLLLGLVAGLAPGPLMTLVLAHSLRHGPREGCKVALAPLLTDPPIIFLAWLLAAQAAEIRLLLALLSFAGGAFVFYLALDTFRSSPPTATEASTTPNSWARGVLTNLLSPHPWLFWMTVGAATLANALTTGWTAAALFLSVFYVLLVGAKLILALAAGQLQSALNSRAHHLTLRSLGILLALFAILLCIQGWQQFH